MAAEERDPLPHPGQAVPAAGTAGTACGSVAGDRAAPVVGDLDLEAIGAMADGDGGAGRPGVADDVGEGLLRDPEGRRVDRRRQRPRLALDHEVDREARGARALDERGQPVEPGGGLAGRGVVRAEHAQRRPQLGERVAAGVLDGEQGVAGVVGPFVQHVGADPGLHRDAGQGVGDRVVEVAGDPHPLLGDPAAGLLLPGLGQVPRPFLQRGPLGPPAEDGAAEQDRTRRPAGEQRGEERGRAVEGGGEEHRRRRRRGQPGPAGARANVTAKMAPITVRTTASDTAPSG